MRPRSTCFDCRGIGRLPTCISPGWRTAAAASSPHSTRVFLSTPSSEGQRTSWNSFRRPERQLCGRSISASSRSAHRNSVSNWNDRQGRQGLRKVNGAETEADSLPRRPTRSAPECPRLARGIVTFAATSARQSYPLLAGQRRREKEGGAVVCCCKREAPTGKPWASRPCQCPRLAVGTVTFAAPPPRCVNPSAFP